MTASPQLDGRIDFNGTLAQLVAAFTAPAFPVGTMAYTTDFGQMRWNGTYWENETAGTIAASATVTQAAGTPIASELTNVTSTAAGAVTLPASVPGNQIVVHNISAFTVTVFPNAGGTTTEKINALTANSGYAMATNTSTTFTCATLGQWYSSAARSELKFLLSIRRESMPEPNEVDVRNQEAVLALSNALVSKAQMTGQINVLEIELKCFLLTEAVQLLTELIIALSNGLHTDVSTTEAMTERVLRMAKNIEESVKAAPRLVLAGAGPQPRVNGSKHN